MCVDVRRTRGVLGIPRQDDGDGKENCLAESDKDIIKANIVPLMCRAPPEVQRQVRQTAPCSHGDCCVVGRPLVTAALICLFSAGGGWRKEHH